MGKRPDREWTEFDEGLLYTLWVVASLLRGRPSDLHAVYPHFAIDYAGGERIYTASHFRLLEYAAPGDGTYSHDSGMFFATGRAGLTMTAAVAAGRAMGNSRRRRQAALDAVPRWMPVDQGMVWVGNKGFWIETARGLFPWPWELVQGMSVTHQGAVQIQGHGAAGPINWQVVSPASEMLFALWVLTRRVPHPQWMGREWIPANWLPWATGQGKRTPFTNPIDINTGIDAVP